MNTHSPGRMIRLVSLFALLATIAFGAVAPAAAQDTGMVRITLRGCPDGPINPNTNSLDSCTIPLDAPDEAVAMWGVTDGIFVRIHEAARDVDGTYVIDVPGNTEVWLRNFEPVAHNNFELIGGDDQVTRDPWTAKINVVPGTTRDIVAFYWNGEGGFSEDDTGTLTLRLSGCPDGIDPTVVSDPKATCTTPLDAPDAAYVTWDMESGAKVSIAPRQNDGTYVIVDVPPFQHVSLMGFEPSIRDTFITVGADYTFRGTPFVNMHRAEKADIDVYYYNRQGSETPVPQNATLNINLRGCPDGVDPSVSSAQLGTCTTPLDAPDGAGVFWGGDGQGGILLAEAERLDDGTYQIVVPANRTLELPNFEPTVRDTFVMRGVDGTDAGVPYLTLAPGDVALVNVYYYNEP